MFSSNDSNPPISQKLPNLAANPTDSSSLDSLCRGCRYDETKQPTTTSKTRRSGKICKSVDVLRKSAEGGCWICQALLSATSLWADINRNEWERLVQVWVRYDRERFTISGPATFPKVQLFCPRGQSQVFRFISDTEIPLTASSVRTLNFIHHNLNKCIQNHTACQNYETQLTPKVNDNWPRRILRIDAEAFTVRLVDFDESMRSKYVALSYCWGRQEGQLIATRTTLPGLKGGINISDLPATLKDAALVAIKLNSSFIWIDSICIIQDDQSDWDQEAGKMSTVYAQSLVTIIASSASSCSEGFLDKHREQSILVGRIKEGDEDTEIRARTIYDWGHHRGGPQAEDSSYMRWMDPVDGRAWILQERLLSGRYVNFTTGETQWGCLSARCCECDQELYGNLYEHLPPEAEWFAVVEEYTNRKLTKATDKLTAVAGIARKLSTSIPWKWYVAGIWLSPNDLQLSTRGLLWKRLIHSPIAPFHEGYIAPSFSWASIRAQVTHSNKQMISFPSTILEVEAQPNAGDSFGRLDAAVLKMYGPLIPAKLKWEMGGIYHDLQAGIQKEASQGYTKNVDLDGSLELVSTAGGQFAVQRKSLTSEIPECSFEGVDVHLLPLSIRELGYEVS